MKPTTKKVANLIRQCINRVDEKAEVILFGSRARGDEHQGSDWDIVVLTDYPVNLEKEMQFREYIYDLELERGEHFSLFFYSKKEWVTKYKITPLYQSVSLEGIQL
jgi:predicted nucleotidyltransferase